MKEYSKKLHIRKDGKIEDIVLYTDASELPIGALPLRDGNNIVYAAFGNETDSEVSRLRVRKSLRRYGSRVYPVLKSYHLIGSASFNFDEVNRRASKTYTLNLPSGTKRIRAYATNYPQDYQYYDVTGINTLYIIMGHGISGSRFASIKKKT